MMNMSHEGRINALFVLCPGSTSSFLSPWWYRVTSWPQCGHFEPLRTSQEHLRGHCELSLEFYSKLTKYPIMGLFESCKHCFFHIRLNMVFANNLCIVFSLSSLLARQISPTFTWCSKFTFSGDSMQRIPKSKTHFVWNVLKLRTGLERCSGMKSIVFLERTQVHFLASSF